MSLMIVVKEILQNYLKYMHSFLSIPLREDTAQYYASLLIFSQLSIVQFKIFMAKNSKVFKDANLSSHDLQLKATACEVA